LASPSATPPLRSRAAPKFSNDAPKHTHTHAHNTSFFPLELATSTPPPVPGSTPNLATRPNRNPLRTLSATSLALASVSMVIPANQSEPKQAKGSKGRGREGRFIMAGEREVGDGRGGGRGVELAGASGGTGAQTYRQTVRDL
jgi:hypothetical protein